MRENNTLNGLPERIIPDKKAESRKTRADIYRRLQKAIGRLQEVQAKTSQISHALSEEDLLKLDDLARETDVHSGSISFLVDKIYSKNNGGKSGFRE
jgi:hypothetical protein